MPFYSNAKKGTHCYQACVKMVLKHIFPKKDFSFKKLDKLTHKPKNKWTWHPAVLLMLLKLGIKAELYTGDFDYSKFVKIGENYIRRKYAKEAADSIIQHSDIKQALTDTEKMLKFNLYHVKRFSLNKIKKLFHSNYVIIAVNSKKLNRKKGYSGHFILMTGYGKNNIFVHDPGLPPIPNRKISNTLFNKAYLNDVVLIHKK